MPQDSAMGTENRERAISIDNSLKKAVDVLSDISEQNRSLITGATTGARNLGADISAAGAGLTMLGRQIAPITHTDPAIAVRPHHGMFIHNQGIMRGMAALADLPGAGAPVGIDPYTYREITRQSLSERLGGGAKYALARTEEVAAEVGAGSLGWAAGAWATAKLGAALGTTFGPVGTFIGGLGGAIIGGLGAEAVLSKYGPAAKMWQQREITDLLGRTSWRFAQGFGEDPLGGLSLEQRKGFASEFSKMVGQSPMSHGEGTQVLQVAVERGMFDTVNSIKDMTGKMKEFINDIKTVSNRAHVDYVSAARVMADMKDMGYQDYGTAARTMDVRGMMAGRTVQEMLGIARQGAEMFRGTGVPMQFGAEAVTMNLTTLRTMQRSGLLSAEYFRQVGGIDAEANALTAGSLQFMMSPLARGLGLGMMGPGGTPDMARFQRFLDGGVMTGLQQSMGMVTPENILKFSANQEQFFAELGPQGVQAMEMSTIYSMAETIARNTFGGAATREQIINVSDMLMRQRGFDYAKRELFKTSFKNPLKFAQERRLAEERAAGLEAKKTASEIAEEKSLVRLAGKRISKLVGSIYDSLGVSSSDMTGTAPKSKEVWGWGSRVLNRFVSGGTDIVYDTSLNENDVRDSVISQLEDEEFVGAIARDYDERVGTREWLKNNSSDFVHESNIRALEKDRKKLNNIVGETDARIAFAHAKGEEGYDRDVLSLRLFGTEWSATNKQQRAALIAHGRKIYGDKWVSDDMKSLRRGLGDRGQELKELRRDQLKEIEDLKKEQKMNWEKGDDLDTVMGKAIDQVLGDSFLSDSALENVFDGDYGTGVEGATFEFLDYVSKSSEELDPTLVGPQKLNMKYEEWVRNITPLIKDQAKLEKLKESGKRLLQGENIGKFRESFSSEDAERLGQHVKNQARLVYATVTSQLPTIAKRLKDKHASIILKDPKLKGIFESIETKQLISPDKFVSLLKGTALEGAIPNTGVLAEMVKTDVEAGVKAPASAEELTEKEVLLKINKNMDLMASMLQNIAQKQGLTEPSERGNWFMEAR